MLRDTSVMTEAYNDRTSTVLCSLHKKSPRSHPSFNINSTISGTPKTKIIPSATARLTINMFVKDCLIFLSVKITYITNILPTIPVMPMAKNAVENPAMKPTPIFGSDKRVFDLFSPMFEKFPSSWVVFKSSNKSEYLASILQYFQGKIH